MGTNESSHRQKMETTLEMLEESKLNCVQKKTPDAGKTSGAQGRVGAFGRPIGKHHSSLRGLPLLFCFSEALRRIHYLTSWTAYLFPKSQFHRLNFVTLNTRCRFKSCGL